jgi:hypothetical protein
VVAVPQSWAKKKGESGEAYQSFLRFRDLGPDRTLSAVYQGCTDGVPKHVSLLKRWSARWAWVERCEAWDSHLQAERDRARLVAERKWEERRLKAREAVYRNGLALRARAAEMLRFPLAVSRTEKDGRTIVIHPAKWTFSTAAQLLRLAFDLIDEAIGPPSPEATRPEQPNGLDAEANATIAEAMLDAGMAKAAELKGTAVDEAPPE